MQLFHNSLLVKIKEVVWNICYVLFFMVASGFGYLFFQKSSNKPYIIIAAIACFLIVGDVWHFIGPLCVLLLTYPYLKQEKMDTLFPVLTLIGMAALLHVVSEVFHYNTYHAHSLFFGIHAMVLIFWHNKIKYFLAGCIVVAAGLAVVCSYAVYTSGISEKSGALFSAAAVVFVISGTVPLLFQKNFEGVHWLKHSAAVLAVLSLSVLAALYRIS